MADNLTERLAFTHRQWNSERQRWDYPLPAALAPALRELLKLNGEQRLDAMIRLASAGTTREVALPRRPCLPARDQCRGGFPVLDRRHRWGVSVVKCCGEV